MLLETLVAAVAEDREAVRVSVEDEGRDIVLRVSVAPDDMGRVIGRRGRVASAMRTIVRAGAGDTGVHIEIQDR